jgi:hypothetical protein
MLASASLLFSGVALITAANVSTGDEGVVRMSSLKPQDGTTPTPTPEAEGTVRVPSTAGPAAAAPMPYPQPQSYAPYFERSLGATEVIPRGAYGPEAPFGPILMFESNFGSGLGYKEGYQRANARVPKHIDVNKTVLMGDVSASVTWDGLPIFSAGGIFRTYDSDRNRIYGFNGFFDYDKGYGNGEWTRATVGTESLGKYLDARMNVYMIAGDNSQLLSSSLLPGIQMMANSVYQTRVDVRDNAYSGGDFEIGGPLPLLGRYGMNMYPGAYYLSNPYGGDSVGFQVRWEALITQNLTVNTWLSHDGTFDTNAWVSLQYEIPNYRKKRLLRDRGVRERLLDPVVRANRIHTNIDTTNNYLALVNPTTGGAYNLMHVNPNATVPGDGTYEHPFATMQLAKAANNAAYDIIRIQPNADDSGSDLTINGGMGLFDNQILMSSLVPLPLSGGYTLPVEAPAGSTLAPLLSDPVMGAGGSVIRLANNNSVLGLRFDASNAAQTVFGTALSNPLPITDATIVGNEFTNYGDAVVLQDVSGHLRIQDNVFKGLLGPSNDGLRLSVAGGSTADVLVADNTATDNSGTAISLTAGAGSTLNADNPTGSSPTGIVGNTISGNGFGISVNAAPGSVVNAAIEGNTIEDNTFDGLQMTADNSTFNLASLSGNTINANIGNGVFVHYLNGGVFNAVSEDLNGNGSLDAGEDLNGNGRVDYGIVSNTITNNKTAGICIFGEDASTGRFDIGGPTPTLANDILGNTDGGILADLRDTATAQMDVLGNNIQGGNADPGLTIMLDFVDPSQGLVTDANGRQVGPFGLAAYGFNQSQYDLVTKAILATVEGHYRNLATSADSPLSTLAPGRELNLDFVIGDTGTAPSNGATEYYVITIGDSVQALGGLAGQSADIGNIRNATGQGPGQGLQGYAQQSGASAVGVYTNEINQLSPFLNPPNAMGANGGIYVDRNNSTGYSVDALTSGNLTFTRRAIGLVSSHELGHALSLRHIQDNNDVTPNGLNPIMGTPAIDLPIQALVQDAGLSLQGQNPGELPGEAPFTQFDTAQLVTAIGTRPKVDDSANGIRIEASDNARLLGSTFNNNTIAGTRKNGIEIVMNDSAVAESVTIQGNQITGGGGNGIRLEANGAGAQIHADHTIGGLGTNVYGGTSYTQANQISGNELDGFQALATNGGLIRGNLIGNDISGNTGNGAALLVDKGGEIDFGTPGSNRVIRGNKLNNNGGAGLLTNQLSVPGSLSEIKADVLGNDISGNGGGGIVSRLYGVNNAPPVPPALIDNNRLDLVVGGIAAADANTISGNTDVGIDVYATGNGNAMVDLQDVTVSGTIDGAAASLDGDGIRLRRDSSALITADLDRVFSTGNKGNGLLVETQGNDKTDPNQPNSGTANTVTVHDSSFSNNVRNGAVLRTRGDSTLIADISNSTFSNNAPVAPTDVSPAGQSNGLLLETAENSSIGDPADGLPPGRRSRLEGNVISNNRDNGISINAIEDSRVLLEVTSAPTLPTSTPHAAASSLGSTSISNNGLNGIDINTPGGRSDILVTSTPGAKTTISGNGVNGGGNGIRWNASGNSEGTVRVVNSTIASSVRGPSEDTNGDGVLTAAEDLNQNGEIDFADGDGIQANFSQDTTSNLIIGGVGEGNIIQKNGDDGIALTAIGDLLTGTPRPIINISGNTIGGTENGIDAGNGGNGISLNNIGGTAVGTPTASVDFTLPILSFNGGVTETGPLPQLTIANNVISNNAGRGVSLLLNGAAGLRDRDLGVAGFNFDPVRISMLDNTIQANGEEGVFFRGDTNMNQSRFTYLGNTGAPNDDNQNFSPFRPEFDLYNLGTYNGNTGYMEPYLNLNSVQNTLFEVRGNTIRNNGRGGVTGEGLRIDVGTGAYVAADVQNNVFGGNLEADFATSSFLSAGNTFDSADTSGQNTFDYIYLDDVAQMDLRFQTNTGNQIDVTDVGAFYTNNDTLKAQFYGTIGVLNRDASFFQVDNGPNLNSPNNIFNNFGITQDIQNAFNTGNYNIRAAADPIWPNPGFLPFLP